MPVPIRGTRSARGITIVDAGLPGPWPDLESELAAIGRSFGAIRALVLTHGHSDHIGPPLTVQVWGLRDRAPVDYGAATNQTPPTPWPLVSPADASGVK